MDSLVITISFPSSIPWFEFALLPGSLHFRLIQVLRFKHDFLKLFARHAGKRERAADLRLKQYQLGRHLEFPRCHPDHPWKDTVLSARDGKSGRRSRRRVLGNELVWNDLLGLDRARFAFIHPSLWSRRGRQRDLSGRYRLSVRKSLKEFNNARLRFVPRPRRSDHSDRFPSFSA